MKQKVLISGASFAGLTLAYWLNKFGYQVTVVERGEGLRTGGSPIDVRGQTLDIVMEMGIWEAIKSKEFVHPIEIVDAQNETLATVSINEQEQYMGDIEIHRGDLLEILFGIVPKPEVDIIFSDSITYLTQQENHVEVEFESAAKSNFDFVFGADGTHSLVRTLVFGKESNFKQFFGAYFAFADAGHIATGRPQDTGIIYREVGKQAVIYQFKDTAVAALVFRAPALEWDYRDQEQQKLILKHYFGNNKQWKIPEILDTILQSDNLYFDEVCQIHMPSWTKGRVALVGDAAHAPSFFTGMGTSLAIQGATLLAKALHANNDYHAAFAQYNTSFKPYVENVQAGITRGLQMQLPESEEELEASIRAWSV
ncbi:FAD-dependent monooxygenase [Chitinophaga sp. sic0106]|uniref:FAD-dependent monooxygenase n=1 Tax=Chitinophaga sp. sic0106 TaxID=2854785 RepID=UPI001C490CA7|nr:FAD-dependent monooxygenase [Chitinophaga sp. sic0106]MBV7530505.1 FAD-dependent monooxygenase [Chitinophaga sp. sic0106]